MAESAVEEDERGLAVRVDAVEIRLQQHAAVRVQQTLHVRERGLAFVARVALRIARAGADARLHDEFVAGASRNACSASRASSPGSTNVLGTTGTPALARCAR